MMIVTYSMALLTIMTSAQALKCWVCDKAPSNVACKRWGRLQTCQSNQRACQTEVRRGSFGILITKRCKQAQACDNNFIQNPRAAWSPSQCNSRTPSSVCRCCCNFDECNAGIECAHRTITPKALPPTLRSAPTCAPMRTPLNGKKSCQYPGKDRSGFRRVAVGTKCSFSCNKGFMLRGSPKSSCNLNRLGNKARFNRKVPTCKRNTCFRPQTAPANGELSCNNGNKISSVCKFKCNDGYVIRGNPITECLPWRKWRNDAPTCEKITCEPPHIDPIKGLVTCNDSNNFRSECRFECATGFSLVGDPVSTCARDTSSPTNGRWTSVIPPTCLPIRCLDQVAPRDGAISCTDSLNFGSVCTFTCDSGYFLNGTSETTCVAGVDVFGEWNFETPTCLEGSCPSAPHVNANSFLECSRGNLYRSRCYYDCDDGYTLQGTASTECTMMENGSLGWNNEAPFCRRETCSDMGSLHNGRITCSNDKYANSLCSFQCDTAKGYKLYPAGVDKIQCSGGSWTASKPCCVRDCPPYAVMDLVLVLDSSSSIGKKNWKIMKEFVGNFTASFHISSNVSRVAIFRYNRVVDTNSQILLNAYPDDKEGLLRAYDEIPYDGRGTKTGQAVKHVNDHVLQVKNGDRPDVMDVVVVITDGKAQDGELLRNASKALRDHGTVTYAIGIGSSIDQTQLQDIGGSDENVMVTKDGFSGLNDELSTKWSEQICSNRCRYQYDQAKLASGAAPVPHEP